MHHKQIPMSSVPAFVDVSGGPCNGSGPFRTRQHAAMLPECCPCLGELSVEEGKTRGDTGGHHETRSKGRSLHRTSPVPCQAFLGGVKERSSGENKGNLSQWKGKSHVICIPHLVSVGSAQ